VAAGGWGVVSALPERGEVWWCEMAEVGRRPVVVLSRDADACHLRGSRSGGRLLRLMLESTAAS